MNGYNKEDNLQIFYDDCNMFKDLEEHDNEIYNKAINDFKKEIIDMVNNSPVVENDSGEKRPMNIEEMCEIITKQLKNNNKQGG